MTLFHRATVAVIAPCLLLSAAYAQSTIRLDDQLLRDGDATIAFSADANQEPIVFAAVGMLGEPPMYSVWNIRNHDAHAHQLRISADSQLDINIIIEPGAEFFYRSDNIQGPHRLFEDGEEIASALPLVSLFVDARALVNTGYGPDAQRNCDIYPIAIEAGLVDELAVDALLDQIPNGNSLGNFSFLTWAGKTDAPTLASSLEIPGNVETYFNPDQVDDLRLDAGDWVQGSPGIASAASVRANLDLLIGHDIALPLWDTVRAQGSGFDYHSVGFGNFELVAYRLTGKGWLSFVYKGVNRCYNTLPRSRTMLSQHQKTPPCH